MIEWWQAMDFTQQIFAIIAIASTILLIIQVVLLAIGFGDSGGTDTSADAGGIGEIDIDIAPDGQTDINIQSDASSVTDVGLRLFTIQGIIAFFAIFGWSGLIMLKGDLQPVAAVGLALVFGFVALYIMAIVMKNMLKLQSDGTLNIKNAVGKIASVYLTIPKNRSNTGKINVTVQERFVELDALTDNNEDIHTGAQVKIIGISNGTTVIVEKF